MEAEFRRKVSAKDDEKLVQYKNESSDERCKKRKRQIVTDGTMSGTHHNSNQVGTTLLADTETDQHGQHK